MLNFVTCQLHDYDRDYDSIGINSVPRVRVLELFIYNGFSEQVYSKNYVSTI